MSQRHLEVLSSRILLRPRDLARSQEFYGTTLGLAVYREFGEGPTKGMVYFLGGGFLEVSGRTNEPAGGAQPSRKAESGVGQQDDAGGAQPSPKAESGVGQQDDAAPSVQLWLQVRSVDAVHDQVRAAGVEVLRPPVNEPWGLREMWIADPDGIRIVIIEVPEDHPLRRR